MASRRKPKRSPSTEDLRSEEGPPASTEAPIKKEPFGPEILFGAVAPMGAPSGSLVDAFKIAMERLNYDLKVIKLSEQLARVSSADGRVFRDFYAGQNEQGQYEAKISAGDRFCALMEDDAAVVSLGVRRLREIRSGLAAEFPERIIPDYGRTINRQAFYFHSLKRPAEVEKLRSIYGHAFLLISAHAPRDYKIDRLSRKIASSDLQFDPDLARGPAETLLNQDESEGVSHGQNVRHTYPMADFFVSVAGTRQSISDELWRFLSIWFGYQFHTPKPDEQGMALAYLAALRSAHPVRQVGAAITTEDGSAVAIGCNEVPKAFGGLYWPDDPDDRRDFQLKEYESLAVRKEVLEDILKRLDDEGFLTAAIRKEMEEDRDKFFEEMNSGKYRKLRESRLMDSLEFDRTVHAEMAAITDAARRGVSLKGCTLYSNTFPCHNCARHIVAAGIKRVVYTVPFAKSLAKRLHGDSICVDAPPGAEAGRVRFDPFLGISPNLYSTLFTMRKRMGTGDRWKRFSKWEQRQSAPLMTTEALAYMRAEVRVLQWLSNGLSRHALTIEEDAHD